MVAMDHRRRSRKYSQGGAHFELAKGTRKQHSVRATSECHGSISSKMPGEQANSSSSVVKDTLPKSTSPNAAGRGGGSGGAAATLSDRKSSARNRDVRFAKSDNREAANSAATKRRTSHRAGPGTGGGGGTTEDLKAITNRIMRDINDLLDVSHLETDQFISEIMTYIGTLNSREMQYKIKRVVENYRFLVKQADQHLAAREQLLSDLADWFLQKDLPDFWQLVEPDTDDKKTLFLRTVAEVKVNFDKFMRFRREIGMLAFRGENVDLIREQKKAIEENIVMLLHRLRDLQPAALMRDSLSPVYFAESDLLSARIETTWETTTENIRRLLRDLQPCNDGLIRLIEGSMNRLAADMVSQTAKVKELTGRLLEAKSVEEHWKDENFSLSVEKATLEERLRLLEAHVADVVELRQSVSPTAGGPHTAESLERLLLPMDRGRKGRQNSLQTAQELEFLRSQAKLLKMDNWELQKECETRIHELELLEDRHERSEDKILQVSLIVRQLEAALTIKSVLELHAMKKDRVELAVSPATGSSGRWKKEEVEEVVRRYADHAVMPVCPRCQCVFEWKSNNDFIASLHELVLRQQKLLDRFTADVPPSFELHLDMSDESLTRTMQLMRQHQADTDTKPQLTEGGTADNHQISSTAFGTRGKTNIVDIGTQTLHLHSDVTSLLRSFFTTPISQAAPPTQSGSPQGSRTDVTQMGLAERRAKAEEERLTARLKKRSSTTSLSSLLSIERTEKLIEEDAESIPVTASASSIAKSESSAPDVNTRTLPYPPPPSNRRSDGGKHTKEAVFLEVHSLPVAAPVNASYHHQQLLLSRGSAMKALLTIYKIDPNEIRAGLKMFKEATDSDADGALGHLRVFFDSTNSLVEKSIRFMGARNRDMRATLSADQLQIFINRLNEKSKRLPGIKYLGLDLLQSKLFSVKQLQPVPRGELTVPAAMSPKTTEAESSEEDVVVNVKRWRRDVGLLVKQAIDHCQQVTVLNQSALVAHAEEYAMLNDIMRQSPQSPTSPSRTSNSPFLLPPMRVSPVVEEEGHASASPSQLLSVPAKAEQQTSSDVWLSVSGMKISESRGHTSKALATIPLTSAGRRSSKAVTNFRQESAHLSIRTSPKHRSLSYNKSSKNTTAITPASKTTPTCSLAIHPPRHKKETDVMSLPRLNVVATVEHGLSVVKYDGDKRTKKYHHKNSSK